MPCAVAISSSPVFSPSHIATTPVFCKPAVTLAMQTSTPSSPYAVSPLSSPFRIRKSYVMDAPVVLKRKRPLRIEIPVAPVSFATETAVERVEEVEEEGEEYNVYCKRGKRGRVLEDRFSAVVGMQGDDKQAFFGVFDGHGGVKAAEYVAKNLDKNIMEEVRKQDSEEGIEEAVKEGYVKTDAEFLKEDVGGGACCATVLIRKGRIVVSNAGDCRVVMSRGGVAEALTVDHRPSRKDEKERVETMGGYVDLCNGVWRIQGSLAVSRGIGDRHLKKWVISEPETTTLSIRPDCEFLILASDGLWDMVSNQEAVDVVRPLCTTICDKMETFSASRKLAELAATRGSTDDISVMVICLPRFFDMSN